MHYAIDIFGILWYNRGTLKIWPYFYVGNDINSHKQRVYKQILPSYFPDILTEYLIFLTPYSIVQLRVSSLLIYFFTYKLHKATKGDEVILNNAILKELAEYHFRNGASKEQVSEKLGISLPRLNKLMGGKQIVEELEFSKSLTDYKVENALLKKALGYYYDEIKESEKEKGDEKTTTHKEYPPDVSAIKIWLESRCPEYWGGKGEKSSSDEKLDIILSTIDRNMNEKS